MNSYDQILRVGYDYILVNETEKDFKVFRVGKSHLNGVIQRLTCSIQETFKTQLTTRDENGKYNFVYVVDNLDDSTQNNSGGFVVKRTGNSTTGFEYELVQFTGLQTINSADLTVGDSTTTSTIPQLLKFLHDEIKLIREHVSITNSNNAPVEFVSQYS